MNNSVNAYRKLLLIFYNKKNVKDHDSEPLRFYYFNHLKERYSIQSECVITSRLVSPFKRMGRVIICFKFIYINHRF